MGWSTSAPTLPGGASWSPELTSGESVHANNYYNFRIKSQIARGAENTVYVAVQLQVYGWNYGQSYPYVTVPLRAQVSVGNTSSYASSDSYDCSGNYGAWSTARTLYYTGTASKGTKVYARCAWSSSFSGANTHTAPAYVTTYAISYNGNGPNGAAVTNVPAAGTKVYGENYVIPNTTPKCTGYVFSRWNDAADGKGPHDVKPGDTLVGNLSRTWYAQWVPASYTVSYNANGGSGTTDSQTKTYGTPLTLSDCGFTKTGHHFLRWNTAADGSGTGYDAGASYTANAAATLYAIWAPDTYAVDYDGNGAESGSTESQVKTYNTPLVLRENGFTRQGYAFSGWNTAADGTGTSYAAGASYTGNEAVTLYAQWTKTSIPAYVNVKIDGVETVCQGDKAYACVKINGTDTVVECDVYANVGGVIVQIV